METTESDSSQESGRPRLGRRVLGVVLAAYWVAMFLGTHVDIAPPGPEVPNSDKVVHFLGYCGLATLFAFWVATERRLTLKVVLGIMLTLAAYALFDELSQIPVGRECDVMDWVADMLGASLGVSVVAGLARNRTSGAPA